MGPEIVYRPDTQRVPGGQFLLSIRILRLLRIFRILKLVKYVREAEVDEESLAVEVIIDVAWCPGAYLAHEHTVRHMREVWCSSIYERAPWTSIDEESAREGEYLEKAQQTWRDNLARYAPPNHSEEFLRELHGITENAREALDG